MVWTYTRNANHWTKGIVSIDGVYKPGRPGRRLHSIRLFRLCRDSLRRNEARILQPDIVFVGELFAERTQDRRSHQPIGLCPAPSGVIFCAVLHDLEVIHFQKEPRQHDDFDISIDQIPKECLVGLVKIIGHRAEADIRSRPFSEGFQLQALVLFESCSRLRFPENHIDRFTTEHSSAADDCKIHLVRLVTDPVIEGWCELNAVLETVVEKVECQQDRDVPVELV